MLKATLQDLETKNAILNEQDGILSNNKTKIESLTSEVGSLSAAVACLAVFMVLIIIAAAAAVYWFNKKINR